MAMWSTSTTAPLVADGEGHGVDDAPLAGRPLLGSRTHRRVGGASPDRDDVPGGHEKTPHEEAEEEEEERGVLAPEDVEPEGAQTVEREQRGSHEQGDPECPQRVDDPSPGQ